MVQKLGQLKEEKKKLLATKTSCQRKENRIYMMERIKNEVTQKQMEVIAYYNR